MTENVKYIYQMRRDYLEIFSAWNKNISSSDIYHMILDWISIYGDLIKSKEDIDNILRRMDSNESVNPIVEDFIYGDCYKSLRKEFGR
jgi:hypothetical protein